MAICENFKAFLVAENAPQNALLARARCKQWSCAYCAEINKRMWRARIFHAAETLAEWDWSFITITAHSKARSARASLDNLKSHWSALRKRLKRKYGSFHFVRVYERHNDGAYHLHALLNVHFDDIKIRTSRGGKETPYSAQIDEYVRRIDRDKNGKRRRNKDGTYKLMKLPAGAKLGLGYYTHAENMRSARGAAVYVSKYLTKDTGEIEKYTRRIQTSIGFPKLPNEASEYEWSLHREFSEYDAEMIAWRHGREIYDVGQKRRITTDDFELGTLRPPNE